MLKFLPGARHRLLFAKILVKDPGYLGHPKECAPQRDRRNETIGEQWWISYNSKNNDIKTLWEITLRDKEGHVASQMNRSDYFILVLNISTVWNWFLS